MSSSYLLKQRLENGLKYKFGPQTSHYVTFNEHCLPGFEASLLGSKYGPKVCSALPIEPPPRFFDVPKLPAFPKLESYRYGDDAGPFTRKLIPYSKTYYTAQSKQVYLPSTTRTTSTNPGLKPPPDWDWIRERDYLHLQGDKISEVMLGREDIHLPMWPKELPGRYGTDGIIESTGTLRQMLRDGTGILPMGRSWLKHQ